MKVDWRRLISGLLLAATIMSVAMFSVVPPDADLVRADGPNMVRNPSFEGQGDWRSTTPSSSVATEWNPWWISRQSNTPEGYLFEPQFTRTFGDPWPPSQEGVGTQKLHSFHSTHDGGVWQRIGGLSPGATYTFCGWAWGLARNSDGQTSDAGAQIEKLVGIDPTGQDPFSSGVMPPTGVIWSGPDFGKDTWSRLCVSTATRGDAVTVWLRSKPNLPVRWNSVWWDNVSLVLSTPPTPTATPTPTPIPTIAVPPPPVEPQDERYFSPTGYRISDDKIWDYYNKRGRGRTFGLPISRKFRLLGKDVQFFQRRVIQIDSAGNVGQLNLLDPDVMPYNAINGATFPKHDPSFIASLPPPGSPGYATAVADFVKNRAPDVWNGMNVNFLRSFTETVKMGDAFPSGGGSDGLLFGMFLEMWGVPTAAPAADPNNHNFVYQPYQRGIMHFNKDNGVTQGLLIGDYFKSVITGQNLPPDLDGQAKASRFYKQYFRGLPQSLARPAQLPDTEMTHAFEPGPRQ
ncbi:MAG: hypothetical protein HY675_16615 [Chloroflexi bacterium]|nr:hypothetical protein [Chloroflexota bacterium]